jgi:hypothetical protein
MNTCVFFGKVLLLGKREPPKVGEVFLYDVNNKSQYPYMVYDLSDGSFLWTLTDKSFNKSFKDLQKHRQEQLEEILK